MCTPVFHVIISASVFNSFAFLWRKAVLHSQQTMVQNKAAEQTRGLIYLKNVQKMLKGFTFQDHTTHTTGVILPSYLRLLQSSI